MAIYRTLFYADVTIGVGGRVTIPQTLRNALRLNPKDAMTVRVEETSEGKRQMVFWRAEEQPEE
jgi:bifunctional DNA-binding transcriptional regulator/antitoxin component of YhaV-PrlF toxin-antitoxin module